jgi:PhoH-like ATPase
MLEDILSKKTNIYDGISLKDISHGIASGSLFLQAESVSGEDLAGKADDKILAVVNYLTIKHKDKYKVVLVSKDTIMRIKARQKGLEVQDYRNDIIIEDTDLLYQGAQALPDDFWEKQPKSPEVKKENKSAIYEVSGPFIQSLHPNEFVYSESGLKFEARVTKKETRNVTLSTITDYTHHKNAVWGITARNREQNFSLNLLLDPEVDVVSLLGQAGTGKTLLALAAGLVQVMETKLYKEIIITRVTVPMGVDIGFLPGTEEEKMTPWMGALEDNLEVLAKPVKPEEGEKAYGGDWGRAATMDLVRNHIKVKSLNFMRGRTFLNKFLIVDEAQNLTPKLMKALMTRAGPGTKVVCLGNLAQIDTPYLTEGSSGLTHLVDSFKGWRHNGHITLIRGERSRLADHANRVL